MADPSTLTTDPAAPARARVRRVDPLALAPDEIRSWRDLERDAAGCHRCELHRSRTQVVVADGDPDADLMLLGDAPSRHDDLVGRPFVGGAGNILSSALAAAGLDRDDCYLTTVVKCLAPSPRAPSPAETEACSGYLTEQIAKVRPRVLVTLGAYATDLILGRRVPLARVAGYRIEVFDGVALIPTFHPADALRGDPRALEALTRDLRAAKAVLDGRVATAPRGAGSTAGDVDRPGGGG